MAKPLKAYSVQEEESGLIVFATSGIAARREGANELSVEFKDVISCNRAPWADQYAEQGWVPVKALLEQGWWQSCNGCGCMVSADSTNYEDEPHEPVIEERGLYCSPSCKEAEEAEIAARKLRKQQRTQAVLDKYPEAEILWVNDHDTDATVTFKVPWCKHSTTWKVGETTMRVHPDDLAAWEADRSNSHE